MLQAGYAHLYFKRIAFMDFVSAMVMASSEAHAVEAREKLFPVMKTSEVFVTSFVATAAAAALVETAAVGADGDDEDVETSSPWTGIASATQTKFDEFRDSLSPCGKNLADLLAKTHAGTLDKEFLEIADHEAKNSSFSFEWTELFKATPDGKLLCGLKVPSVHAAAYKWIKSTQQTPTGGDSQSAIGDMDRALGSAKDNGSNADEEQMRSKTAAKCEEHLNKLVHLTVIEGGDYEPANLTKAWKNAKRPQHKKTKEKAAVGADKLFLAFAELFPKHSVLHSNETFRGVPQQCSTEFTDLVKWLGSMKCQADVVAVADGRSDVVRNELRAHMKSAFGDEFLELWLVFDMETSLNTDVRNPKRKLAWSCANLETIFAAPPDCGVGGSRRKVVPRDHYTKSGESTNFCRSYTGVAFRNLSEIPRLTSDKKMEILGASAVGDFTKDRVQKEVKEKGHPLFWGEWKPVHYYSTLMRDFDANEVCDWAPGAGAACIAALYYGIPYTGFCQNEAHKEWLWGYIKRVFLAIVLEKKDAVVDADLAANVARYLERTAEVARQLLPSKTAPIAVDSYTGDNDSNDDE